MKQSHRPTAEAFERLCAPYSGMVYRHCLHMLGNPHEAEDAAQESMLRAFRAFDAFRGDAVASWLRSAASAQALASGPVPQEYPVAATRKKGCRYHSPAGMSFCEVFSTLGKENGSQGLPPPVPPARAGAFRLL